MSTKLSPTEPRIGENCHIHNSTFGAYVEIHPDTTLLNTHFGDYSYCARGCDIANTQIGKFSNIAASCRIGPTDHPMDTASLHHFLYRSSYYFDGEQDDPKMFEHRATRVTHIGHDTWIGHGVIIKPDITIGHGAIVAAGAVVTKDVAPYTIVGGVTAKPIRKRFDDKTAERMMALAWWDWSHKKLHETLHDFRTLKAEAFLEKYES